MPRLNTLTRMRRWSSALILSLLLSPMVNAENLGIDGAWYNPAQSGHGVTLAQATDTTVVAIWHTYDAAGNALTLYADLTLEGDVLSGTAYAPKGMRFGSFNPQDLQMPVWGEISLKVGDQCKNLTLNWQSALPTYGNGETRLVRLAGGANQPCSVQSSDYQLLSGTYMRDGAVVSSNAMILGAIDANGELWTLRTGFGLSVHTRPYGSVVGETLIAGRDPTLAGHWTGRIAGSRPYSNSSVIDGHSSFDQSGNEHINFDGTSSYDGTTTQYSWLLQPTENEPLPVRSINDLAGEYHTWEYFEFLGFLDYRVEIDATGHLCYTQSVHVGDGYCAWEGQVTATGADGMFDFTIRYNPWGQAYVGRGWKQTVSNIWLGGPGLENSGDTLVMVGRDENGNGFGLAAYRSLSH